jgi:bacillithiol synthase
VNPFISEVFIFSNLNFNAPLLQHSVIFVFMNKMLVDRRKTPFFSAISNAISYNEPALSQFIGSPFSIDAFANQITQKSRSFSSTQRKTLVKQLEIQYEGLNLSPAVFSNIQALQQDNCFTVTTGHQLCLFGGPLYFVYKIVHAIRLAEKLRLAYPNQQFVPVFWMASEDHDFLEINHVNVFGKKIAWENEAGNAVGRMELIAIQSFKNELLELFKNDETTREFIEHHYTEKDRNLAYATRRFVNDLFGNHGVVIIDGDDKVLKRSFLPILKKEISEQFSFAAVERTIETLRSKGFKPGVNPREINLFYLGASQRSRIIAADNVFEIEGQNYTEQEVLQMMEQSPERFSPNVVMRPLYQEFILPNLAYIGGGGEIAYWLELKEMFETAEVPYPLVQVRNSIQAIDANTLKKLNKLQLNPEQLFGELEDLKKQLVAQHSAGELDFENLNQLAEGLSLEIAAVIDRVDEGLKSFGLSEITKLNNQIEGIKQKLIRQEKKKHETEISSLEHLYSKMFPDGALQERKDSLLSMMSVFGKEAFLSMIFDATNPEEKDLIVLH